jgi:glycerol-3-phosphate acyltransferase PlsX
MRIVVDAMGSDHYPEPDVAGAVMAAREWGDEIILVGDARRIEAELAKHDTAGLALQVVHASEVIEMTDKPAESAKQKTDSSMHVGMNLVKNGEADGYVTMGNTGGVLAVATLHTLKRIRGIKRPALAGILPNSSGYFVSADIGANADCRPEFLVQFALMASAYTELALGVERPRVALLSNGEEEGKGNTLVKETAPMLADLPMLNYVGNVEPKEIVRGDADVVIQDGFTGNVFLKTMEATAKMVSQLIREEIMAGTLTKVGGALARPAFDRARQKTDPSEVGGAPLLGVDGVVIIGHGRSDALGVKNGIRQARMAIESNVIEAIREGAARI